MFVGIVTLATTFGARRGVGIALLGLTGFGALVLGLFLLSLRLKASAHRCRELTRKQKALTSQNFRILNKFSIPFLFLSSWL